MVHPRILTNNAEYLHSMEMSHKKEPELALAIVSRVARGGPKTAPAALSQALYIDTYGYMLF